MPQLSYVNISDVLNAIGYGQNDLPADTYGYETAAEEILDRAFDWVSFGDACYTLVGNNDVLENLVDYLRLHYNRSDSQLDEVRAKFWALVGDQDYINMEG